MNDSAIKIGDTVRLRSGGPVMTVSGVGSGAYVVCSWFVTGAELRTGNFMREALKPAKTDDED